MRRRLHLLLRELSIGRVDREYDQVVAVLVGDDLIVFGINPTDGRLTMKQVQATPPKPTFVGFLVR